MAPDRSRKSAESRRSMAAQAFTGDFLRGDRSKCRDSHGLLNACRSSERRLALRPATKSPISAIRWRDARNCSHAHRRYRRSTNLFVPEVPGKDWIWLIIIDLCR
jgi:hypothetical protein